MARAIACIIMFCVACGFSSNSVFAAPQNRLPTTIISLEDISWTTILPDYFERQKSGIDLSVVNSNNITEYETRFAVHQDGIYFLVVPVKNMVCVGQFTCGYKLDTQNQQNQWLSCSCKAVIDNGISVNSGYETEETTTDNYPQYTENTDMPRPIEAFVTTITSRDEDRTIYASPAYPSYEPQVDCLHTDTSTPTATQNCKHLAEYPIPANQFTYVLVIPKKYFCKIAWSCNEKTIGESTTIGCRCK